MEFEIDVSGEDLLSKNYTICVDNKDNLIKGFKFNDELVKILCSRYGQGVYKYSKSKKGKSFFKIRIYCVVVFYLFKSINCKGDISLNICRDFPGKETNIIENFIFFLQNNLGLDLKDRFHFSKLHPESNAHKYAYLMRVDTKNKMKTYIKISLEDIERWLGKR